MANISKLVKKMTGKQLGNLVIKDVVLQMIDPQDQSAFRKDELDGAISALQSDIDIRDYNNRIQIKNFLIEIVGRRDYAQLLAGKNSGLISITALLEKQYLQEAGKPEPLRFTYSEYLKATEKKLDEYYRDDKGNLRKTTMLEILHDKMNIDEWQPEYDQPISALELQYYRDGDRGDIADDGTHQTADSKEQNKIQNLLKRTTADEIKSNKDMLQVIIDYIKQPDLFETEPKKTTYKYTAWDTLCELPYYIEYLSYTGNTKEIEPVMKRYEKTINETIAHLENKKLAEEMKRLSLYDLATKEYAIAEIAHKYDVDFSKQAWGNDDDNQTHILITPNGKLDDVRGDLRFFPKTGSAIEQMNIYEAIEKLEESVEFCKGYDLMIDTLAEHLGIPELCKVKSDMKDLEYQKSMIYGSVLDLARYCAIIGEYGQYLNKQTSDEIKDVINKINQAVCKIKYIADKNRESEPERKQKMQDMLAKCELYGQRFIDIQNKFFTTAMGNFAE